MGQWKDFNPNDYTGEYEPKVTLETTQKTLQVKKVRNICKYTNLRRVSVHKPEEYARLYLQKALALQTIRLGSARCTTTPETPPVPPPTVSVSLKADLMPDQEAALLQKIGIQVPTSYIS